MAITDFGVDPLETLRALGRQLPAEDMEGRARPKGNSRQAAAVRTESRGAASIRLAVVGRAMSASKPLIV